MKIAVGERPAGPRAVIEPANHPAAVNASVFSTKRQISGGRSIVHFDLLLPVWVIFDRVSRFCVPVHVRFGPNATENLCCQEMTRMPVSDLRVG
jgi:hypothetical protein